MVHFEQRPHACTHCDKTFLSTSKLKQHYNIHTGARPFKCKYCSKDFTNFPNWLKHTRRLHKVDHRTGEQLEEATTTATPPRNKEASAQDGNDNSGKNNKLSKVKKEKTNKKISKIKQEKADEKIKKEISENPTQIDNSKNVDVSVDLSDLFNNSLLESALPLLPGASHSDDSLISSTFKLENNLLWNNLDSPAYFENDNITFNRKDDDDLLKLDTLPFYSSETLLSLSTDIPEPSTSSFQMQSQCDVSVVVPLPPITTMKKQRKILDNFTHIFSPTNVL